MQIQIQQINQYSLFNSRLVNSANRTGAVSSLHARRRMLEAKDEAKEMASVRVTISGEAMALARQAKAMERMEQSAGASADKTQEMAALKTGEASDEPVQLTDEEICNELLNQVNIWGDKTYALSHHFNHKETAEMAKERAEALTQLQKLEELQKSELSKLQKEAQESAGQTSIQQEEVNRKNSELIMMIESFEDQDEEEERAAEGEKREENDAKSPDSLMKGKFGAMAAKREMGMRHTIDGMEQSSAGRIEANDYSIRAVDSERKNINRMNQAENFSLKEKIASMTSYVGMLANKEEVNASFQARIGEETDPEAKKKLQAMMAYFDQIEMKDGYHDIKKDREFALQERITARDLRIAHLGSRHLAMAEQQEKELQSLFDEDDILRAQGQDGVSSRTEEIAERLQEKLDERDQVDNDTKSDEEIRKEEDQKEHC